MTPAVFEFMHNHPHVIVIMSWCDCKGLYLIELERSLVKYEEHEGGYHEETGEGMLIVASEVIPKADLTDELIYERLLQMYDETERKVKLFKNGTLPVQDSSEEDEDDDEDWDNDVIVEPTDIDPELN